MTFALARHLPGSRARSFLLRSARVVRHVVSRPTGVRPAELDACGHPVLLLPGFLTARGALDLLARRLERDGYSSHTVDMGGLGGVLTGRRIEELAEHTRREIERLYERFPRMGSLTIVGHSQGGLVGAYYVKKLGGQRRARALITLGTPHNGTPVALLGLALGFATPSIWQMTPLSPFIRNLRATAWPAGIGLTSIYSHEDRLAPHPAALIETFDRPVLRNVKVDASHSGLLFERKPYEAILCELRALDEAERWQGAGPSSERRVRLAESRRRRALRAVRDAGRDCPAGAAH